CKAGALPAELRPQSLNGREDRIRTCGPLVPNQVLYQAELLPVIALKLNGAPERSRTPNLLIRSQTLYPIELRALEMPRAGLEPARRYTLRRILSPVRLPIPPPSMAFLERKTGFEPATPTLARWCSTTELLPLVYICY